MRFAITASSIRGSLVFGPKVPRLGLQYFAWKSFYNFSSSLCFNIGQSIDRPILSRPYTYLRYMMGRYPHLGHGNTSPVVGCAFSRCLQHGQSSPQLQPPHLFIFLCRPLALHVGKQVGQRCGIEVAAGREEDAAVDSELAFPLFFSSIICPVTIPTMTFSAASSRRSTPTLTGYCDPPY